MSTKSQMKYKKLMDTAERLFTEHGYKAISMDQIAEEANISKMTIYSHFESKEDLFFAVILELMNRHYKNIEKDLSEISSTLDKLNYLLQYSLQGVQIFSLAFYKDTMSMPNIIEKVLCEKNKKNKEIFGKIIKEGMEKGEIRRGDSEIFVDTLITLMEVLGKKYFNKIQTKQDVENMAKTLFEILKYGLLGGSEVNVNGQQPFNES